MGRRDWLRAGCAVLLGVAMQAAQADPETATTAQLRSLAVLDFELIDDQNNPLTKAAQELRLRRATQQLQSELSEQHLYRIVDPAPSEELQRKLRSQQEFLHRCDDCAVQIGQLLGADLVMSTWVQKVSELILNLNVQITDVKARKLILSKSVDMRGNEDQSWTRAVHYLVRDMVDRRGQNPNYGQ
jgi:hypothetical protein